MEYMIGFALISFGFQDTEPLVPAIAGVVVITNAAVVRGPFGAFRFVTRRLHRWLDVAVMAFLVGAAVQPWAVASGLGRVVLVAIVVPLGFLWWYTDWAERKDRAARRTGQASVRSDDVGKRAGRAAANVYKAGKRAIDKRSES